MAIIRPQFPSDRVLANTDNGFITPAWDAFFRGLLAQLPRPGEYTINSTDPSIRVITNGRSLIDFRSDGTIYLDDSLQFPTLSGDISNTGLVTKLRDIGTPIVDDFVRITTDSAGRVIDSTPVEVSDITALVDPVYVNTSGDTMTGNLSVPSLEVTGVISSVDSVQFDTSLPTDGSVPGRLQWNPVDETLDLGMAGGVTQQVGQELYARVRNQTGSTIPNGTVVGFSGATSTTLLCSPYLANGSQPSLYTLGVLTQDLPNNTSGLATVFGNVRELNTSAFTLGDVLYASPTVTGAYTNIKPTAPNNVIPLAAVTSVGVSGSIFVRPTIEQEMGYGKFVKTVDQSIAVINTAELITITSTTISHGVTLSAGSRITFAESGVYSISTVYQLSSSSASQKVLRLWYRKNGVNITDSAVIKTTDTNGGFDSVSRTEFLSMNKNDYIELYWAADSTAVFLDASPATAYAPGAPALAISVIQVQL